MSKAIAEGNKLIAEFMELIKVENKYGLNWPVDEKLYGISVEDPVMGLQSSDSQRLCLGVNLSPPLRKVGWARGCDTPGLCPGVVH